jgi:hypothetical protein
MEVGAVLGAVLGPGRDLISMAPPCPFLAPSPCPSWAFHRASPWVSSVGAEGVTFLAPPPKKSCSLPFLGKGALLQQSTDARPLYMYVPTLCAMKASCELSCANSCPHFPDEDTEAQRVPESHNWGIAELGFAPGSLWSLPTAFCCTHGFIQEARGLNWLQRRVGWVQWDFEVARHQILIFLAIPPAHTSQRFPEIGLSWLAEGWATNLDLLWRWQKWQRECHCDSSSRVCGQTSCASSSTCCVSLAPAPRLCFCVFISSCVSVNK